MSGSGVRPKLIEVALPLAAVNAAASREKSIRHGHPSTLHLWWARRPLAATRAVIWASLVDDPSGDESLTPEEQDTERQRLFGILERLVVWENSNDPVVLAEAKAEIDRCFPSGDADSVARAKNTSLAGIETSGIGEARRGEFRLFERGDLAPDWSPVDDPRLTVWEVLQYLVAALERSESEAAELLHTLGGNADRARQLAYVLYAKANDNRWTTEAGAYNTLITAWPNLTTTNPGTSQQTLL